MRARSTGLSILGMTMLLGCGPSERSPAPPLPAEPPTSLAYVPSAPPPPADSSYTTRTIAGCDVRFADAPALAPTDLAWGPCPSSADPACRELSSPSAMVLHVAATHTREGPMLLTRAALAGGGERDVVGPPDGPARVVFTVHCTPPASAGAMAIGRDGAALELHGPDDESVFLAGPFAPEVSWHTPAAAYGAREHGEVILDQPFAVAGRSIRAVDARLRVFRSSPATSAFAVRPAHFRATLGGVVAVGDATIAVAETIPETWVLQLGEAAPIAWYTPPRGGGLSAPAIDGDTLYVLVGSGRDRNNGYAAIDVYATPVPTSAAAPVLRHVGATSPATLHWMSTPVAGAGRVAWRAALDREHAAIDVLELASSRRTRFVAPLGTRVVDVRWVSDTELGAEVTRDDGETRSMTSRTSLWRIPLASLPDAP